MLTHRVSVFLTAGTMMRAWAFIVVVALIVQLFKTVEVARKEYYYV